MSASDSLLRCRRIGLGCLSLLVVWKLAVRLQGASEPRCDLDAAPSDAAELDLKKCRLRVLPSTIARFTQLRKLDLAHNELTTLPPLPPSIETIFLLGNRFEALPPSIGALPALRMLSFKSCRLRSLASELLPESLEWLILTDNQLEALPHDFGKLRRMRKLMLANNRLSSLPRSMERMTKLELLRLANNRLKRLPDWLTQLPMLTWLAVAGNPAVEAPPPRQSLERPSLSDLRLLEVLGEGTSGVVRRAQWRGQTVAVKIYKQALSSDGRNADEVAAVCAVDHPHVVRVLGAFDEPLGTVMEWTAGYKSLGKPPSMSSVTRDTYAEGSSFSLEFTHRVACGISAAASHLHDKGLSHGDLYAHNILVQQDGEAKLGDFGAAFYYGSGNRWSSAFERLEVRAFGCLLEELLDRPSERISDESATQLSALRSLAHACMGPADARPLFAEIVEKVAAASPTKSC